MVKHADSWRSRWVLAAYFAASFVRRVVRRPPPTGRLTFSLCGEQFVTQAGSAQLGGIHDVWLGGEYDAYPYFKAEPGMVVLDIGANVGAYTRWQLRAMSGIGTLIAVEASPTTAQVLATNIGLAEHSEAVTLVEAAVWRESGQVSFSSSQRNSSTSGIAETIDAELLETPTTVRVDAISLGDLLERFAVHGDVHIIKIDVEGAECEILLGLDPNIAQRIHRIVVEVSASTENCVRSTLEGFGFAAVGSYRSVRYYERTRSN